MDVVVLASFLVLSLLCGVQGESQCVSLDNDYYYDNDDGNGDFYDDIFCGCEFQDAGVPIFNVSLDFFDKRTVRHEGYEYAYSPCHGETDCKDGEAAVCRTLLDLVPRHESIGLLGNVTYTVNNATFINISARYVGEDGASSVVNLVCTDDKKDNGTLKFVHHDRSNKIFYLELSYSGFCVPTPPTTSTTFMSTVMPTMTSIPVANSTTMSSMTMTMSTIMSMTSPTMIPTIVTSTGSPTGTSKPSGNKNEENRKVVLGVVLSIVGAIIVGVIMAIIVYYLWKRRRGTKYEQIPSM